MVASTSVSLFILAIAVMAGYSFAQTDDSLLHFRMFTSYNREGQLVTPESINKYSINVLKPVIIIVSDLMGIDSQENYTYLMDQFFQKDNFNMFLVTRNTNSQIMYKVDLNGFSVQVAEFISALLNKTEPYITIRLVGFKSGGAISSTAANGIASSFQRKISRVTALEPTNHESISADSAQFVDVLHKKDDDVAVGSADIYVGGQHTENLIKYFADSITDGSSDKFKGVKCSSRLELNSGKCNAEESVQAGENISPLCTGKYFIKA